MRRTKREPPLLIGALVVGLGAFAIAFYSIMLPGVAWDEAGTISAGSAYLEWIRLGPSEALSWEAIDLYWVRGSEHPPLGRLMAAAGIAVFARGLGLLQSARVCQAACFGALCALIFHLMARYRGIAAGIFSAASFALMPRVLGHAMLAGLDLPMAATWFLTAVLFARSVEARRLWFLPGIGFGLALLTKVNGIFILLPLAIWGLSYHRKKALIPLAVTFCVGLVIFFAGWPWLWHDTVGKLVLYVQDKMNRDPVETYYLGRVYGEAGAPWHYPIVMTFVTVPLGLLAAAIYGLVRFGAELRRSPVVGLLFANLGVVYGVAMLPNVPKYDGVRLFLPAFPFLACFAGLGLAEAWDYLAKSFRRKHQAGATVMSVFFAVHVVSAATVYPFVLAYYNLLVGGARGASALGFETTYWGEVVDGEVVEFLNGRPERGLRVAISPYGSQALELLPLLYDIREDIELVEHWDAPYDYMVVVNRQGKLTRTLREVARRGEPVFVKRKAGVTLCAVYRVPPGFFTGSDARGTSGGSFPSARSGGSRGEAAYPSVSSL